MSYIYVICGSHAFVVHSVHLFVHFFFFQAEDGIRDIGVTGVQTCALPIFLLMVSTASMWAQGSLKITGKVVDNNNEPMIGVSVIEKGTNNGSITDLDGNYVINTHKGATLELDRKSTRLNSSHANISYAVFCLKKKNKIHLLTLDT